MNKKQIAIYEVKGLFRELLNRIEERSKEFVDDVDENALY